MEVKYQITLQRTLPNKATYNSSNIITKDQERKVSGDLTTTREYLQPVKGKGGCERVCFRMGGGMRAGGAGLPRGRGRP